MSISASVGHSGKNHFSDVKLVQTLFNLNRSRFPEVTPRRLVVDGMVGRKTVGGIERFQREVMRLDRTRGMVVDHDPTMRALIAGAGREFSEEKLAAIMPHADPRRVARYARPLAVAMPRYGIDKPLRMAHFLAQLGHESGSLRFAEELASGEAYEGRVDLGNTQRGDGRRFKGRGLIQLTGRANYQAYSDATGIDYVANPRRLAEDPEVAVDVSCWYWQSRRLNGPADDDDVTRVTRRINGGYNGLDDRVEFLARSRCLLGA